MCWRQKIVERLKIFINDGEPWLHQPEGARVTSALRKALAATAPWLMWRRTGVPAAEQNTKGKTKGV